MKAPIRVFLVANLPPPLGGMTTWTRAYLAGAARHGLEVTLRRVGPRSDAEVLRLSSRLGRIARNVVLPISDVALRGAKGADVIHVCASGVMGIWSGLVIAEAAALRGIPIVLHIHSSIRIIGNNQAVMAWLGRLGQNPLVRLVTPSHEDAAGYPDLTLIDNLASDVFTRESWSGPTPGKPLRLLFLGWLIRIKGLFELVEALSQLDDVTVDLVGPEISAADASALRRRIEELNVGDRVTIKPTVPHDQLPELMKAYDALVLPSHVESFGLVSAEAMLFGLPVIGTRVGLLWDMPDTCFAPVPARDAKGLAAALAAIRDQKQALLPRLSKEAKALAQATFTSDAVLSRWRKTYEALLSRV